MALSRAFFVLSLALPVLPASADVWEYGEQECNELWFSRNLIMDRAGYCFGSPLGQALFDNANCHGSNVALGAENTRQVERIRALEAQIGCKVNTGQTWLDVPNMDGLRRLRDMALPDNGASACTWAGAPLPYYDGYSAGAQVIGQINVGDRIGFGWIGEGDWTVIAVGGQSVIGWVNFSNSNFEQSCADWAG
ncbi:YARHG domain-containing protein [Pseudoruegeria sp. SK021]|uniref:YARHG domain-containing protein n=1 Tax=Pseudoruegeria sp. SK021 TaxID=1933035 RepID=UPI000A21B11D|nr:DUF4453 domain-containing protein [Pseudoruegeria sp. SK021]OSP53525.1 hypothetical protein BV911_17520 [Pseudoruegeria sp. SK021]